MSDFELQLKRYRLSTAEILCHLPDQPSVLPSFIWHTLDLAPEYPVLTQFPEFWRRSIDGKLHSVTVASAALVKPSEFRFVGRQSHLH